MGENYSKLCVADKMSFQVTPRWLYLPMVNMSGEVHEYMAACATKYSSEVNISHTQKEWHKGVRDYMSKWIEEYKDLKQDTWTKVNY